MDYQKALKNIQEGSDYWKPKGGQYKVKALTELEETEPFIKGEGETREVHAQAKIRILVNGEEKTWTFGIGKTPASTFGQLVQLATQKNNTLSNVEFTVVVKNDGTKNDYTIIA